MSRRDGFTLIELVSVIVVLAILAAVAVPSLASLDDSRGAAAATTLHRDLTWLRQRASATGTRAWCVFDTTAQTWTLLGEDPAAPGRAGATVLNDMATGHAFVHAIDSGLLTGVRFTSVDFDGDVEVGFDWLGRPINAAESDLAADGWVVLTGGHRLDVRAETGHVERTVP